MGVQGLWRLLEPAGRPVPLDQLGGAVLAVDISIWLHQMIKGFQDAKGASLANSHLMGLFQRLCKLLYYGIKPVFVFDGGFPALKKQTIINRQSKRAQLRSNVDKIRQKLMEVIVKRAAVQTAFQATTSFSKSPSNSAAKTEDDMFKLPALQSKETEETSESDEETPITTTSKFSHVDLHSIDVYSQEFKKLSARERHDILTELKETRKQNSWGRINELPSQSDNFSSYQMNRLLKRRQVQVSLEETEKEIGGHYLSLNELEILLNEEGIDTKIDRIPTRQIASDENSRYVLVKNIKEAVTKATEMEQNKNDEMNVKICEEKLGSDCDSDLKRAIELSLTCDKSSPVDSGTSHRSGDILESHSVDVSDSEDEDLKKAIQLSLENKSPVKPEVMDNKQSRSNKFSSAKAYMMEYSGLTENEIDKILDSNDYDGLTKLSNVVIQNNGKKNDKVDEITTLTVHDSESERKEENLQSNNIKCDTEIREDNTKHADRLIVESKYNENISKEVLSSDSDDFEEVPEKPVNAKTNLKSTELDDDLFSDIFEDVSAVQTLDNFIVEKIKSKLIELGCKKLDNNDITTVDIEERNSCINADYENKNINENSIKSVSHFSGDDEAKNKNINENSIGSVSHFSGDEEAKNKNINENSIESVSHFSTSNETSETIKLVEDENSVSHFNIEDVTKVIENQLISEELVNGIVDDLDQQRDILITEQNKLDRTGLNISEQMTKDAQELLKLFGIPYIVAPMEAEAQCAFLENINLTNGTITDDSDIWLFGGKTVYRNFFNQQKHVLKFVSENIENSFRLKREDFILLALLVGSDYTIGITGIGPVTALEILAAFPSNKNELTAPYAELLKGLKNFKSWLSSKTMSPYTSLRKKLKNVLLTEEFPNYKVVEAYLCPEVETSKEIFSWGKPDLASLVDYAKQKFGWARNKTEEILIPVLKRMDIKVSQLSIKSFFNVEFQVDMVSDKMSKRVKKAVEIMKNDNEVTTLDEGSNSDNKSRKRKSRQADEVKKTRKIKKQTADATEVPACSTDKVDNSTNVLTRDSILHRREVIPQREADKSALLKNKLKAVELFRKSKKGPGFVKRRKKQVLLPKEDAGLSESGSD